MPRTKKDPRKPKGKATAYAFFVQNQREAIRTTNKENGTEDAPTFSELSKMCSERWKGLDDTKKSPFFKLAVTDKTRYDEEMSNYVPSEDEGIQVKKSRKRKRIDENQPKRNKSSYLYFCEEERPKIKESQPELSMTEISKVLGALWSSISDIKKEQFTKKAAEDKDRYIKEMADYKQSNDTEREDAKKQRELVK